ncbi:YicC/YloC family endoribonuclease [Methylibium sp.]|uniref:YicC/YloC family endoribonuclease n=1 Tax=Methylibium sp. TaxID=2067992 RepID=UPI0017B47C3B|nr:YicC/YloC family endoribonuclease [Methylibium sp.]MBA3588229.1 YicC family protein [Methylibium sp.]
MSVYSMTGYANASAGALSPGENATEIARSASAGVQVELRSVNSRFLDIAFRLPEDMRSLEPALRELIAAKLRRGKVELRLSTQGDAGSVWPQPQTEQLNALSRLESTVQNWLPKAAPLSVQEALQWCRASQPALRLDAPALDAARRAVAGLVESREREGEKLVAVLMQRLQRLRELARDAQPLVPQVVARQQQRFLDRWTEALEAAGASAQSVSAQALQERAMTEAASYAIRIDVAEELARLTAHLDEIERLLGQGGEVGKRLDFLIQELQREANTLGSKSAALELTQISVEMKVAVEQMREQVQNIE